MSLSKSKKMNLNPRINIIINNNNPINYTGSTSSIFINSFSGEKALKKNGRTLRPMPRRFGIISKQTSKDLLKKQERVLLADLKNLNQV